MPAYLIRPGWGSFPIGTLSGLGTRSLASAWGSTACERASTRRGKCQAGNRTAALDSVARASMIRPDGRKSGKPPAGLHLVVRRTACAVTRAECWACNVRWGIEAPIRGPSRRSLAGQWPNSPSAGGSGARSCRRPPALPSHSARSTSQLACWTRVSSSRCSLAASSAIRRSIGTSTADR